jgi:hypothetical protein
MVHANPGLRPGLSSAVPAGLSLEMKFSRNALQPLGYVFPIVLWRTQRLKDTIALYARKAYLSG